MNDRGSHCDSQMGSCGERQLQSHKRKRQEEQTSIERNTTDTSQPTKPGPIPPSIGPDLTQLHTLPQLMAQLKLRLPEVDEEALKGVAEFQLKNNASTLRRIRLAKAQEEGDDSDAFDEIKGVPLTVPLSRETWYDWVRQLKRLTSLIDYADDILFTEDHVEFTPYLTKLDKRLSSTIFWVIGETGAVAIDYTMNSGCCSSGRSLFRFLESQLKPHGDWEQVLILFKLNRVAVSYTNVDEAIKRIERLSLRASDLEVPISDAYKCAILLCVTQDDQCFAAAWAALMRTRSCTNWANVSSILHYAQRDAQSTQPRPGGL
ncbi:hypothetical protein BCV69DRAFT_129927 [Microstroma glucosiphilum]|uniref:Uncharacterized protein n=1 Tax=Pseudomicrostroma glucosiphilum TaxID=1684307 RepID=A0A316TVZ4_9BASI|nr:hypothetical protein BCV69DRAFT_129927 [Pseudomicrostroma glucosiphilum]PWN17702.1 hypothetical protein BCV69DRAFT_129927 [Pseudomicrostroma glucosiphilum]